jgi:serine/threonine-protein kinase RsbW
MISVSQTVHDYWANSTAFRGSGWREAELGSTADAASVLRAVMAAMTGHGYPRADLFAVHLALEEALVNALEHGNCRDPEKRVYFRYCVDGDKVVSEVEDEGCGFDPESVPDPSLPENLTNPRGRGLKLIRHYMTCVQFNDRGNLIRMGRSRSA